MNANIHLVYPKYGVEQIDTITYNFKKSSEIPLVAHSSVRGSVLVANLDNINQETSKIYPEEFNEPMKRVEKEIVNCFLNDTLKKFDGAILRLSYTLILKDDRVIDLSTMESKL